MAVVELGGKPISATWVVHRGTTNADDEVFPVYLVSPVSATDPGFTETRGAYGTRTITVTNPLDVTGSSFSGAITSTRGGQVVGALEWIDTDPTDGIAYLRLPRTTLLTLSTGSYVFDAVRDRGTSYETTFILGSLRVSGRASA